MPQVRPEGVVQSDIQVQILQRILASAYTDLLNKSTTGSLSSQARRLAFAREVEDMMTVYRQDMHGWADVTVPHFYKEGMDRVVKEAIAQGVPLRLSADFVKVHRQALNQLVSSGYTYLDNIVAGANSTAQNLIDTAARQAIVEEVAKKRITGEAQDKLDKKIAGILKSKGITTVSSNGREYNAQSYASMISRTLLTEAQVNGTTNQLAMDGHDLVIVSDHFGECKLCVLPDTKVKTKDLFSTTAIEYTGDVITIRTASGNELTGTPDHTVLTPSGWLPLKSLQEGDEVVSDNGIGDRLASICPDEINVESRIDEIGKSIRPFNLASPTRSELNSNITYREINIVNADLFLLRKFNVSTSKVLSKVFFVKAMRLLSFGFGGSNGEFSLQSMMRAFPFYLGWSYHSIFVFFAGVLPSFFHRTTPLFVKNFWFHSVKPFLESVMPRSSFNSIVSKILGHTTAGNGKDGANLVTRLSGLVKTDKIVSLRVSKFSGHVYDLENSDNWYVSNNIISHNCRPYENEILSVNGMYPQYTRLDTAKSNGLFHSNCRHVIDPYYEKFASVSKVWDAKSQKYVPWADAEPQNYNRAINMNAKDKLKAYESYTSRIGLQQYEDINTALNKGDIDRLEYEARKAPTEKLTKSIRSLKKYVK